MDHDEYPPGYLEDILREVRTIALVGASSNPARPSNDIMRFMMGAGYDVIPVSLREAGTEILGLTAVATLAEIGRPVDMVQVFRQSSALPGVAEEAIAIGAKVLWAQIGIRDDGAAALAEEAGLKVVMNRCPRPILRRMAAEARA